MAEMHAHKIRQLQQTITDQERRILELEKLVINSDMPLKVSQHDAVVEEHINRLTEVERMADKARATADRAVEVIVGDAAGRYSSRGTREIALLNRINSLFEWKQRLETGFLGQLLHMHNGAVDTAVKNAKEKIRRSL